jgi:uroporphyrinogen III methyltransferase/synthase
VIHLVGSGPGDPGLFTVRGVEHMEGADAVVYDRLAPEALLRHARPERGADLRRQEARRADDGAGGDQRAPGQLGREGKTVVRLKGGDPLRLRARRGGGPGLIEAGLRSTSSPASRAASRPRLRRHPVTHRGLSTSVAFVTGHEDPRKRGTDVDWAGSPTGRRRWSCTWAWEDCVRSPPPSSPAAGAPRPRRLRPVGHPPRPENGRGHLWGISPTG